ncbi:MAG: hypothetical protein IJ174_04980 [Clostridia bacterium]|nr:hypothetical protein [Clostridia bacterium]
MASLYCENCQRLFDGDACPECKRLGRHPRAEDFCLMTSQPAIFATMLLDILRNNGIPAVSRATLGATGIFGSVSMEEHEIFVPYERLEEAEGWLQDFLAAAPVEEDEEEPSQETDAPDAEQP